VPSEIAPEVNDVIILRRWRYQESHTILRGLSRNMGILGFIVKDNYKNPAKSSVARLTYPGAALQAKWKKRKNTDLLLLLTATPIISQWNTIANPEKYTQALYISECLDKFLITDYKDSEEYFVEALSKLEEIEYQKLNPLLPIIFLRQLCRIAGIAPTTIRKKSHDVFDLKEASWIPPEKSGELTLTKEISENWYKIFTETAPPIFSAEERRILLETMIKYVSIHHSPRFELKSPHVIMSLF